MPVQNRRKDMAKKLFRSTLTLIFGAVVVVNLLLAYAPATSVSASEAPGELYTNGKEVYVCICAGQNCFPCVNLDIE